jgi:tryptophan halogenase
MPLLGTSFQHWWVKARQIGKAEPIDRYVLSSELARAGKFGVPTGDPASGCLFFHYALHCDAHLVARYLQSWSILAGVRHVQGKVLDVKLDGATGDVTALRLDGDREIQGELFIDCSGSRGLLIEGALKTGYDDWAHWLPCDRAAAMPSEIAEPPPSQTRSIASRAGWQWRMPLQHRASNGYVFCSRHISEDEAMATLSRAAAGRSLAEPRVLPFRTGIRRKIWNRNVFCLGAASGFLEPLESTGVYLVQRGLQFLLGSFPQSRPNLALQENVNRANREHWEHIRDFLVLHYKLNKREGEPFWDECRHRDIPESLAESMELFRRTGRFTPQATEFFRPSSWLALYAGFGILPDYYHPAVDDVPEEQLALELENMAAGIASVVARTTSHEQFLRANCPAKPAPVAASAVAVAV